MTDLGAIARALPGVEQGVACEGTALESRTYAVAKKSFLFVSRKDARLKLSPSLDEARELGCVVGANGWVKLSLDELPPVSVLRRWIAESHTLSGGGESTTKPSRSKAKKRRA